MYREAGDERRAALAFANTGTVLGMQDRPAEAQAVFERCIPVFRRVGDRSGLAVALVNLAESLRAQGHPDAARPLLQEAVPIQLELGDRLGVLLSVWILANLRDPGDAATTACLLSAVETIGQAEGLLAPQELEQLRSDEETTKARLTSAQYEAARQMGRSLSLQEAIDAALTSAELPSSEIRTFSIPTAIEPNP
jgi:tetratricopeptide (TPR) repeat protein